MTRSWAWMVGVGALLALGCGEQATPSPTSSGVGAAGGASAGGGGVGGSGSGAGGMGGSGASGGSGGGSVLPLGMVVEQGSCQVPANAPAGSSCTTLAVQSCPNVADLDVNILVVPPAGGTAERGTVVLGSGGGGTGLYDVQVALALAQLGFRTVNRAWAQPWETGPGGMAAAACRYATLITWVDQQAWQSGPLCATGNSGGSSEISYALARYGREAILSFAVPTAGPPMGRLDFGCLDDAGFAAQCPGLFDAACGNGGECSYTTANRALIDAAYATTPCADADPAFAATFLADSVVSPDADLDYAIDVHFIYGINDCTVALPLGMQHANAVTSNKQIEWVDAPHAVFSTVAGRNAIVGALDVGCVP